jgi:integrase
MAIPLIGLDNRFIWTSIDWGLEGACLRILSVHVSAELEFKMARKPLPDRFDIPALLKVPGRHRIGHGLSLHVRGGGALWTFQYRDKITRQGKSKTLGSPSPNATKVVSLTEARMLRDALRMQLRNSIAAAAMAPSAPAAALVGSKTFSDVLDEYLVGHANNLKDGIDGKEGKKFLALHRLSLAKFPVAVITRSHVAKALAPWAGRPSCNAIRVKIETVMDYAIGHGFFVGDNPAAKGPLKNLVTLTSNGEVQHHPMMAWEQIPAFFRETAEIDTVASGALRFTLLTAARPSEGRCPTWSEIKDSNGDGKGPVWTIPAERMKGKKGHKRAHNVPLVPAALALLAPRGDDDDALIFANPKGGELDQRDVLKLIKHHTSTDGRPCDVHGLRSSFASWASEMRYPPELIEMAHAHAVGDAVQRAYQRSDKINHRREMMEAWAKFATGGSRSEDQSGGRGA